jgi:hypothetical protein
MLTIDVGISDAGGFATTDPRIRRRLLRRIADAGLDHITMGDHVSFHGGTGFDGMITASTLLASHDRLPVLIGAAEFLLPYVESGAWHVTLIPASRSVEARSTRWPR